MIASLGFLFVLAGGILILTTATGTTGQVLGVVLGGGGGSPGTPTPATTTAQPIG